MHVAVLKLLQSLRLSFQKVSLVRVPSSQNRHTDLLATLASASEECIPDDFVELLEQLSIEWRTVVGVASVEMPSWLDPYVVFLSYGSLLINGKEAKKVRRTLSRF